MSATAAVSGSQTHTPPPRTTAAALAQRIDARLAGAGDVTITGLAAIDEAKPGDLTFISDLHYAARWPQSRAAAAVVAESLASAVDSTRPLLIVRDVEQAMIGLLAAFAPPEDQPEIGVHATAVVHASAKLGQATRIGPHVWVGANCVVGDGVVLHAGARLYSSVHVGAGSIIHANTVIRERCVIGRGVILHQNVSIGADGFGYRPAPDGRGIVKMPHIGTVIIEDGVEIGPATCVDRAKFGATVIGAGTKIDNLVQIAHNCRVGRCCLIAGQSGLGGSTTLGDGVIFAGAVGVVDHISVGAGAKIGARSLVTRDVPAGASWLGSPAEDGRTTLRQWASIRRLPDLIRRMGSAEGASTGQDEPSKTFLAQ
jgi:UDP-3-O-[3-hydroxymyristoyl] glucosamine N-acyltransferase